MLTTTVENYPGFEHGVQGPELIEQMRKQAERFGARIAYEDVEGIDFAKRPFVVKTNMKSYEARSIIIATGASSKLLNIPSEARYLGKGVSTCATCDGPFFKGRDVVVVGGGDTAMEDSFFLTKFAKSVTIVHRRDTFRASRIMQEHVLSSDKIKVLWNSAVEEILGDGEKVTGIRIKNLLTNEASEIEVRGVFIAIGHIPNSSLLKGKLRLDDQGYIITRDEVLTDIEGVYVSGDVSDRTYRQAATASASGVKAALQVRRYLSENKL